MTRPVLMTAASPTLAETAFAARHGSALHIPMQGYGPARRVLAGIVAVALAIGAALPVRAGTDDLATGLAALGALALIAGETEGNPLPRIDAPRPHPEARLHDEAAPRLVQACAQEFGPPYGKAWGYRAKHGCAPAPGLQDREPDHHHGKTHKDH